MPLSAGKYLGLRRLADAHGRFKMVAIDQRTPLFGPIAAKRGTADAPYEDVVAVKERLAERLSPKASAMLLDPIYAFPRVLPIMDVRPGLMLSLEHSRVEDTPKGKLSRVIPGWSVEEIRRAGADAVKVLVWYRHDADPAVKRHQQDFVRAAGEACARFDIVHLLEILIYPLAGESAEQVAGRRSELVLGAVADFADPAFGVDIYKLEAPGRLHAVPDPHGPEADAQQARYDRMAGLVPKPWVLLSAGAGAEDFRRSLTYAYRAGASGYLSGRAIWQTAFAQFPDLAAMDRTLVAEAMPYLDEINGLTDRMAAPWSGHPGLEGGTAITSAGLSFPEAYPAC